MSTEPLSMNSFDVEQASRSYFKDPDWMFKTGLGGIFAAGMVVLSFYHIICIPVVYALWALCTGYCLRLMRVRSRSLDLKLPDWNDWGDLFLSGITWIALQHLLWLPLIALIAYFQALVISSVFSLSDALLRLVAITLSCLFSAATLVFFSFLSSFLMVHFACRENSSAAFAVGRVISALKQSPKRLITAYLLAQGIQWGSVLLPALTLIGLFIIPSTFFTGQILSSTLLALAWGEEPEAKEK